MKQAELRALRRKDGIALIAVLLTSLVLVMMLLAISVSLALSTSRSTSDQQLALQAQYAAESGLALVRSRLIEAEGLMLSLQLPQHLPLEGLEAHASAFCRAALEPVPPLERWTAEQRETGVRLCSARPVSEGGTERYTLFTSYAPQERYPADETPETYWQGLFSGPQALLGAVTLREGLPVSYEVRFGLTPLEVRRSESGYHFIFSASVASSQGQVGTGETVLSTRRVQLTPAHERLTLELRQGFSGWSVSLHPGSLSSQGIWQARGQ